MLNRREEFLLNYINKATERGYAVIDLKDILIEFPNSYAVTEEIVVEIIKCLSVNGYINLRYNDNKTFCVISTEKGRAYGDTVLSQLQSSINHQNASFGWCFFGGFIGAFLGALIICAFVFIVGGYA